MKKITLLVLLTFLFGSFTPKPLDDWKTIHVFVALCDNDNQGIVPVPRKIGNGQDPETNLYWGCGFGIRTYFKKSKDWIYIGNQKKNGHILERIAFRHKTKNWYLVADAYDGKYIKDCTIDYLNGLSGKSRSQISIGGKTIKIGSNAQMLAYIGHDGLMDFDLENTFQTTDSKSRDAIVLACYSRNYFQPYLKSAKANPMVLTSHLMCPEAYTLHDALSGYLLGENNEQVRSRAAASYNKFQKCGLKAARNLLVTGFK